MIASRLSIAVAVVLLLVSGALNAVELPEVASHSFASVNAGELAAEDSQREAEGLPYRFALPYDVAYTPDNTGTWDVLPDGGLRWRLRLASPGALSLNLGFARARIPAGGRLLVYPAADPARGRRLDRERNSAHGQVWTPVFLTDELVVEVQVRAQDRQLVDLEISSIGRGYRFFGEGPADRPDVDTEAKSGACNVDVVCSEADDWRDEINTVGLVQRNGSLLCTGFMVNNTAGDGRPLFMTAFHCRVDAGSAPTLVVYWNYQSPTCGQQGGGSLTETSSGSTLLAAYVTSDFTLLELDEVPEAAYDVKYAGWNRGTGDPVGAACIHHPSSDEKSISFDHDALTTTSYLSATPDPDTGNHLRVADWDVGTTEGGSSGSPLFDLQHRVIGQLHGGYAGCGNELADWYGRFSVSWEGGGTPDSRLRDHLDPGGTGAVTVDLLDPQATSFAVSPSGAVEAVGAVGGPFAPAAQDYDLTNNGTGPVMFTAGTEAEWLQVAPGAGTIDESAAASITATLLPAAANLPLGLHRAVIDFKNPEGGNGSTTREFVLRVVPNSLSGLGAVPNPASLTPITFEFTLSGPATVHLEILDLRGRLVRDLGAVVGESGLNTVQWDALDMSGARAAAGSYVLRSTWAGKTQTRSFLFIP